MQIGSFSLIKELNTSIILKTIRNRKTISRAEIAKITGLTPATVTNITGELLSHKMIAETKLGQSSGGRKPVILEFNSSAFRVVSVCIGKNSVDLCLTDLDANIFEKDRFKIKSNASPEESLKEIAHRIQLLLKHGANRVLGIGVSMEGLVNHKDGICVLSANLGWEQVRVKEFLASHFSLPIFIDNDVKALTLGEKWFGSVKDSNDFILLYTGFGIGGALFTGGQIYRGALNYASEIGHTTIDINGPLCECGNHGCFQSLASENSLLRQVREAGLATLFPEGELSADSVLAMAASGNEELNKLVKKQAYYIGIGLANIINIFNPSLIVISGFICKAGKDITDEIIQQVKAHSLKSMQNEVNITFSKLGSDALHKGTVSIVLSQLFKTPELFFGEV